jgi:hypothetical protein
MEAFSNNVLDKLIVVNPDRRISNENKRLIRFKEFREYNNLEEFIQFKEGNSI